MTVADQLSKVIDKTGRLIELCAALQEENDLLKQENISLKQAVDSRNLMKSELEEKLRVLTLARSLEGIPSADLGLNEKTLDIKQKITEFVREIDKCIVLLKK
ncbi:hypothetical protein SAMN05421813_104166 [Daejeonella rubra]|uniref:Phenylalanyl-tRNA synthetase subunit beta n=1 Tax=Daejeonella rubra TaxID=990371 RepID=A0A1G9PJR0_9SPHI|nr:hypothetical protein [Daejeonella rubra]SDL99066.1 hypothetical protein SAMN05421813_104166 [Daejeonella rubra]